jgi:hypothetical protein
MIEAKDFYDHGLALHGHKWLTGIREPRVTS